MRRSIIVALLLSSWAWGQNLKATSHTLTTAIAPLLLKAQQIFEVLAPMLPTGLVLALERWTVSKFSFSLFSLVVFRVSYLTLLALSLWVGYRIALCLWY
jgi:hypothetical protein